MPGSINSKRLIFNALFQIYLMWALDKDYIRSSQYPQPERFKIMAALSITHVIHKNQSFAIDARTKAFHCLHGIM